MDKKEKVIVTYVASLIILFFIIGYFRNVILASIDWVPGVTKWDKFKVYYIHDFWANFMIALLIAVFPAFYLHLVYKIKDQ